MIKILSLLVLTALICRADASVDKFDLSITSAVINNNTVEFTMKIVNQSAEPVKIEIAGEIAIVKAAPKGMPIQIPAVTVRAGNYKPQFVITAPADKLLFLPSKSSRVFAPQTLAPGESCNVTSSIGVNPGALLTEAGAASCEIFANLASLGATSVEHSPPSPTYKITKSPDNKLVLTAE